MVKKAYLRILEAVIAIILIIGFIILITPKTPKSTGIPPIITESKKFIFNEILNTKELRDIILLNINNAKKCLDLGEENKINKLITENTPAGYSYECEICTTQTSCTTLGLPSKNIYADSISLADADGQITIFRLYFWEK